MNNKKKTSVSLMLALAVALVSGCATLRTVQDTEADESSRTVQHTIAPGDRLSDISLQYTGEVSQWEAIAAYNDITDPRTLRIGDVITIPGSLIPTSGQSESAATVARSASRESLDVASSSSSQVAPTATGTLALQRSPEVDAEPEETGDVVLQPVRINRSFELEPLDESQLNRSTSIQTTPPRVRVVGTYYPKGVYDQPASYSNLMMRVAPGTVLELESEVNDWYKVVTDRGIGYLRNVDGKLIADD
ncbi:MAG: LysM peptidoglycan-binding domain-containing protein [Granulosicoccus sp.]|nr:LysM peptidoglycan-binding domain-containing protein [Granulosicoccus sp.]